MSAPRGLWIGLGLLLVLAGGAVAYLAVSGTPPGEVIEVVAEGSEKVLREPMRPAHGAARVLVFAMDGVGDDALREAIRSGATPSIAALLGAEGVEDGFYERAYAVPEVLSILPSTTIAAWSSLFTGHPAAQTGVPGNEWFVREEMKFYAPAPVSVTEYDHALEAYTSGLVGEAIRTRTIYEQVDVRSYVSLSHIHRGADLLTLPNLEDLGGLVAAVAEGVTGEDPVEVEAYAELDRAAVESLLNSVREHGVADLQVVYFPGIDLYTHVAERPLAEQREYLREVIDVSVAEVLDAYRAAGALEDTYFLFVSDHGHTPVLNDDRHALGTAGDGEPPRLLELSGFRVRPFVLNPADDEQDYQAALAYQGAFAYVYLADRSTCPRPGDVCDWRRPPRLEEDVLAVARSYEAASRSGAGVPALRGTLDLIFAREPRAPGEDALPFQIWDGERLVPISEYLLEHPRPDLLELESRLAGLAAGPYGHRAGDVLLLAKSGAERPIEERYYFSGEYHSWHGSPSEQDSRIPLIVARLGHSGAELRARVRDAVGEDPSQLDVARLIRALLETGG